MVMCREVNPKNKSRHLEMEIEQTAEFKNSVTVLAL